MTMRRKNREFSKFCGIIFGNFSCLCFSGDQYALFSTFSVYTNGKRLLDTTKVENDSIISCLDGVRLITIIWVIHANRVQTYVDFPLINRRQFEEVILRLSNIL